MDFGKVLVRISSHLSDVSRTNLATASEMDAKVEKSDMDQTRWKDYAGTAGAVLLGMVFLVATYGKAWNADDFGAFIDQIRQEELDFLFSATQVALIALALQAGLGTALLLGVRHHVVLLPTAALVVFLIFLDGRNYWLVSQGLREPGSCGCFGSLIERTAAEAFWQNLLLMAPFTLLCFWRRRRSGGFPKRRLVLALLMAFGAPLWAYRITDIEFIEAAHRLGALAETSRFVASQSYSLTVDGRPEDQARIYESEGASAFLIKSSHLDAPLLMDLRNNSVRKIDPDSVRTVPGDALELLDSPQKGEETPFAPGGGGVRFELEGQTFTLGPPAR